MKKRNVIKNYSEFKEILDLRKFKKDYLFTVYYRNNNYGKTRVGILIRKINGIAVRRNLIKRQIRSIIDSTIDYKHSKDFIIVISKNYNPCEYKLNEERLSKILHEIY